LHPLVPFVTEELWQSVAPRLQLADDTIMLRSYPRAGDLELATGDAAADIEWLKAMVTALRRIRSELNVPPAKQVTLLLADGIAADRTRVDRFTSQLRFLNRIERIEFLAEAGHAPASASALVGELKLLVPLEGLVDLGAERARLEKELKRVDAELAKSQNKLASETFVQNAPPAVVEQERQRLVDWGQQRDALSAQRAKLS
jgi:valyl-tRNA synthetase